MSEGSASAGGTSARGTAEAKTSAGALGDAARLAVGTLTTLPVPSPTSVTPQVAGTAMLLGPVAVLPLALLAAAAAVAAELARVPSVAAAALALGGLALGTRGLHLDGLADTADGLASGYDRERSLRVMRSGDVGPAGAVTLLLVLLAQAACLAAAVAQSGSGPGEAAGLVVIVVLAVLLSRCMLPLACTRAVPAARTSGLGATVAGTVAPLAAVVPVVVVAGTGALGLAWAGLDWWRAPLAAVVAVVVTAAVVVRCTRRLGGITGDVLGACVELSFAAVLLVLTAG